MTTDAIARSRGRLWLPVLLLLSASATAAEDWASQAAQCLTSADGFNEGREWAQYRITPDEVRVLAQSGGEDWVFVEMICRHGDMAEGERHKLPDRIVGSGVRPAAMLARGDFTAERLQRLADRARTLARLAHATVLELDVSYVNEPQPRTVYRAVLSHDGQQRTIAFDDKGIVDGDLALRAEELTDAPEPEAPGADLDLRRLTDDPVKVLNYLAGEIGSDTRINRLVLDPAMLTVEWVAPGQGNILLNQWMIIDDKMRAPDKPTPPNQDKVCARQPTIDAVQKSLARALAQPARAQHVRQAALLLLECDEAGKAPGWKLFGGDGKIEAGVPLSQERFTF